MKLAFISYEYPPDTAVGGIATYLYQVVRMLADAGHQVEVFAASATREGSDVEASGALVHRIQVASRDRFPAQVAPLFQARHREIGFEVLEGPDHLAEAYEAACLCPELPYVVKLHTPRSFLTALTIESLPTRAASARANLEAFALLAKLAVWRLAPRVAASMQQRRNPIAELEQRNADRADLIVSPSQTLRAHAASFWAIPAEALAVVPTPYHAGDIAPPPSVTATNRVTFVGRLEARKGVLDLASAIAIVHRQAPAVRFRLVGADVATSHHGRPTIRAQLEQRLGPAREAVELIGHVGHDDVACYLADTDVCVIPSLWENFPMVCLEAMAAGRAIIGSSAGGMQEMLADDRGMLVPPHRPALLASAILGLMADPERRTRLGANARRRVSVQYAPSVLAPAFEAAYRRAIVRRSGRGAAATADPRTEGRRPAGR